MVKVASQGEGGYPPMYFWRKSIEGEVNKEEMCKKTGENLKGKKEERLREE